MLNQDTNTRVQHTNAKLSWGQTRVTPLVGEAHKCHQLVNTLDSHPAPKKKKRNKKMLLGHFVISI